MTTDHFPEVRKKVPAVAGPLDQPVRRVRINVGAPTVHDHSFHRWPFSAGGFRNDEGIVFDAQCDGLGWWCRADGFGRRSWRGESGGYGNGAIYVPGLNSVTAVSDEPNAKFTERP